MTVSAPGWKVLRLFAAFLLLQHLHLDLHSVHAIGGAFDFGLKKWLRPVERAHFVSRHDIQDDFVFVKPKNPSTGTGLQNPNSKKQLSARNYGRDNIYKSGIGRKDGEFSNKPTYRGRSAARSIKCSPTEYCDASTRLPENASTYCETGHGLRGVCRKRRVNHESARKDQYHNQGWHRKFQRPFFSSGPRRSPKTTTTTTTTTTTSTSTEKQRFGGGWKKNINDLYEWTPERLFSSNSDNNNKKTGSHWIFSGQETDQKEDQIERKKNSEERSTLTDLEWVNCEFGDECLLAKECTKQTSPTFDRNKQFCVTESGRKGVCCSVSHTPANTWPVISSVSNEISHRNLYSPQWEQNEKKNQQQDNSSPDDDSFFEHFKPKQTNKEVGYVIVNCESKEMCIKSADCRDFSSTFQIFRKQNHFCLTNTGDRGVCCTGRSHEETVTARVESTFPFSNQGDSNRNGVDISPQTDIFSQFLPDGSATEHVHELSNCPFHERCVEQYKCDTSNFISTTAFTQQCLTRSNEKGVCCSETRIKADIVNKFFVNPIGTERGSYNQRHFQVNQQKNNPISATDLERFKAEHSETATGFVIVICSREETCTEPSECQRFGSESHLTQLDNYYCQTARVKRGKCCRGSFHRPHRVLLPSASTPANNTLKYDPSNWHQVPSPNNTSDSLAMAADEWDDFVNSFIAKRDAEGPFVEDPFAEHGRLASSKEPPVLDSGHGSCTCDQVRSREFPWRNALSRETPSERWRVEVWSDTASHTCAGSLLSRRHVITSSKCVERMLDGKVTVGFADFSRQNQLLITNKTVTKSARSSDVAVNWLDRDGVTVMVLNEPVTFPRQECPICSARPETQIQTSSECFIVDWNQNTEDPSSTKQRFTLVESHRCQSNQFYTLTSTDSQRDDILCAELPDHSSESQPTPGSGLVCSINDRHVLAGIVPWKNSHSNDHYQPFLNAQKLASFIHNAVSKS